MKEEKHKNIEKDECMCENCKYSPLKHFECCPKCESEGFHITIKIDKKIKEKE